MEGYQGGDMEDLEVHQGLMPMYNKTAKAKLEPWNEYLDNAVKAPLRIQNA